MTPQHGGRTRWVIVLDYATGRTYTAEAPEAAGEREVGRYAWAIRCAFRGRYVFPSDPEGAGVIPIPVPPGGIEATRHGSSLRLDFFGGGPDGWGLPQSRGLVVLRSRSVRPAWESWRELAVADGVCPGDPDRAPPRPPFVVHYLCPRFRGGEDPNPTPEMWAWGWMALRSRGPVERYLKRWTPGG